MVFNFRLHKISLYAHSTVAGHWNNFRSVWFWVMWRKFYQVVASNLTEPHHLINERNQGTYLKVGKKGIAPFNICQGVIKTENEIYSSSTFWCFKKKH